MTALLSLANRLDHLVRWSGLFLVWTPLALVLVQFALILLVNIFGTSNLQAQESLAYINALMFLGAAGYTALHDGHVRVDIFYSALSEVRKAWVALLGTLFLLVPFLVFFWSAALPYVAGSWAISETSVEAGGLPFVYLLKSTLLLFALSLSLQAVSTLLRALNTLLEGRR